MKYLYLILRLFLRPKCKHKWEIVKKFSIDLTDFYVGERKHDFNVCEANYDFYKTKIHILTCKLCNESKKEVL